MSALRRVDEATCKAAIKPGEGYYFDGGIFHKSIGRYMYVIDGGKYLTKTPANLCKTVYAAYVGATRTAARTKKNWEKASGFRRMAHTYLPVSGA